MADTSYQYSLATDFPNHVVDEHTLMESIEGSSITSAEYRYLVTDGDAVYIWFDNPLSGADETTLDGLVAAHTGVPEENEQFIDAVVEMRGLEILDEAADPTEIGEMRLNAGTILMKDSLGVFNPRNGTDPNAIHTNATGEINGLTEKVTPVSGDLLIVEDSAAGNAKKKVQIGNLPGGAGGLKTKSGSVALSSFAGDPPSYAVTFAQAFLDANYAIVFGSNRGTVFTWSSKTAQGFTIIRHSGPTGTNTFCDWVAVKHGES